MPDTKQPERTTAQKKSIFVIEDDLLLVKAYQLKLKDLGEVWVASDGKEALSWLEKDPPSVVLLDLMLPGVSGFDVLGAIRANLRWKTVPVIVLSNLGQPQDIKRCQDLGVQDYIVKANARINDVVAKIKQYL